MRKLCFFFYLLTGCCSAFSQNAILDSFKMQLSRAATSESKVDILSRLSRTYMNINLEEADKYGLQMMEVAESSRDRKLIIKALLANGERYSYLSARKENINKAIGYYTQALELAKKNKLDEQTISSLLAFSEISRYIPDADKAMNYCNQAIGYAGTLKNDSLLARINLEYGSVFLAKDEKILALKNFLGAVNLGEKLKNSYLLRSGYSKLAGFYATIEDYDKAIDNQLKAYEKLDDIKNPQTPYAKVQDLTRIGDLYTAKKNYDLAMVYYERSLKKADSLNFAPLKTIGYQGIINNYLANNQPQKALDYYNNNPQLKDFFKTVNYAYFNDQVYGYIYFQLGKYDSAKYYFNQAAPFFINDGNSGSQLNYFYSLGLLYKKTGEYNKGIDYLLQSKLLAEKAGNLQTLRYVVAELDTLYQLKGDYKQALQYASLNMKYKDSADKLGKEKDLLQIEVADEQQRQERLDAEKVEQKRKRDNIQYMLITIGITSLFIIMVMLGMFKVSATTIKLIGFFAFLMFFEFLFLIFKKNIYGITKGEPWKDLLFMILLAAILLPLHHWLEHKVIHYLTSHNRLTASGRGFLDKLLKKKSVSHPGTDTDHTA